MSLYHYVKTKDELVDGLAEVAIAELDIKVEAGRPWDQELIRIGIELHRALRAHPSAIQLLLTHTQPTPSFVAAADKLRVRTPLVVGGRSAGARSAARTARELGASGYLALSFAEAARQD